MAVTIIPQGKPGVEYRTLDDLGFSGYAVGDDGSVWTKRKSGSYGVGLFHPNWRELRPVIQGYYKSVTLSRFPLPPKMVSVHLLVLRMFRGPCPPGLEACHGIGGSLDNTIINLRWDTHSENMKDRTRHGTAVVHRGESAPGHKLKESDVLHIFSMKSKYKGRVGGRKLLARQFGVHVNTITGIWEGRTWKHLTRSLV